MNIFAVDNDPREAANLCNAHIVKMPLESAQILCTVANQRAYEAPYRSTHKHHPVVNWTDRYLENWCWLIEYGLALCSEYTKRYNKTHKCQSIIEQLKQDTSIIWPGFYYEDNTWTMHSPFVQCMPDKYKATDPVLAYRQYYVGEKLSFAFWKEPSQPPQWFKEMIK